MRHHRLAALAALALCLPGATPLDARSTDDPPRRDPRRIALLVGISDYAHFGLTAAPGQLADLQGPANDVERMRVSLMRWGFGGADDLRTLKDAQATKAGLEEAFRWLATRADDPNDAVVIFYSGHGSHAPDGPDKDEPDGRDEGLVPYDAADAHDPKQLLLDDQIREFLAALKTQNVTVIIDACYSGTVTRGNGDAVGRDKGPKPAPSQGLPGDAGNSDFTEARGHTLITAARSDQTAQELPFDEGGRRVWIGAMTYHLTRALDGAEGTRALRYDELLERVRADVRGALLPQVPQLEGDAGAVVFRANQGIAARPFVLASWHPAGKVVLDAGAIHGVRPTAIYEIFPADEVRFASRPIAKVRVDSVVEAQSFAAFIDDAGKALAKGPDLPKNARAVLSRVPIGAAAVERLAVHVHPSAAALRAQVAADSQRFMLTDSARAFAVVTQQRGVPEVLVRGIPLPPQTTDQVVRRDSAVGYAPAALCAPLVRALSIASMEAIANPAPPAELTIDARFVPSGGGEPQGLRDATLPDTVQIGKPYDVYVKVEVPADLATVTQMYMTAAIAGYTSDPFVLWPHPSAAQSPVPLNRWIRLHRGVTVSEPAGSEIMKVVVNSDQYDLRPLVQSLGSCPAPAAEALRGMKGNWTTKIEPIRGWTTLEKRIDIVR